MVELRNPRDVILLPDWSSTHKYLKNETTTEEYLRTTYQNIVAEYTALLKKGKWER